MESLLDEATAVGGLYANLDLDVTLHPQQVDGIAFSRLGQDRRSDNTFDRRAATQMRMVRRVFECVREVARFSWEEPPFHQDVEI